MERATSVLQQSRIEKFQLTDGPPVPWCTTRTGFTRSLDDDAHKALRAQVEPKGAIRIVVVPDKERVAATFFGAGCPDSEHKPRLAIVP